MWLAVLFLVVGAYLAGVLTPLLLVALDARRTRRAWERRAKQLGTWD